MQTNNKENSNRQPVILFADDDELCLDVGVKILRIKIQKGGLGYFLA